MTIHWHHSAKTLLARDLRIFMRPHGTTDANFDYFCSWPHGTTRKILDAHCLPTMEQLLEICLRLAESPGRYVHTATFT